MATYGEVTARISFEMAHDRKVDAATMINVVYDAMREVARSCVPLTLLSKDFEDTVFRQIDDVNFIRQPIKPSGVSGDKIDIDDLLIDAVVFYACKRISRDHKGDYDVLAKRAINDYQWNMFESIAEDYDV